ncbi:metallophosphoesterase family protein [Sporosarcina sp. FSL K6-1508]|uniref:metallophosphoesterase family protein n=1 Tax=Sporosarcina sp. FSL K6-1508 TaxID=2921553 RepID=UPI0030FBF59A
MKLLAFADVRTTLKLPEVEPDIVLLLGDIPSRMVSKIDRMYSCRKLGVMGNHCHQLNFEDTSVINMHNQIMSFDGVTFAGFEGSPVYKEQKFGQQTEAEANAFVQKIGRHRVDILLTHSNPAYGDMDLDDAHRGFQAFNNLIFNEQVTHLLHGHLHDPFTRNVNGCTINSVYPYLWIPDLSIIPINCSQ